MCVCVLFLCLFVQTTQMSAEWNFDVFRLDELTGGRPLCVFAIHCLRSLGLFEVLNLNLEKLVNFFTQIEVGYVRDVPFHNNIHATGLLYLFGLFVCLFVCLCVFVIVIL